MMGEYKIKVGRENEARMKKENNACQEENSARLID